MSTASTTASDALEAPPALSVPRQARLNFKFVRDQIGAFRELSRHGSIVGCRLLGMPAVAIDDPELVEEVLLERHGSFRKDQLTRELEAILGRGLLVSEGELWRRQRKLIAPNLQPRHITTYGEMMVDETLSHVRRHWRDGETRDVHRDMLEATLRIVVQTLFDLDVEHRIEAVSDAVERAMYYFDQRTHSFWRLVPEWVPTSERAGYEEAVEELNSVIYDLVETRRKGEAGDDLLWRLLQATDDEGNQMTDQQLRDEVITLFLAGHETTALSLTYALYLLARHPDRAARVRDEVDRVLGERRPGAADVDDLSYTEAVVDEAMRLYPPVWAIGREAVEDVEIGGYLLPEGTQVYTSQSVLHRDPEYFEAPDAFRPERWLGDLRDELPRYAYFPFGGGPRICIGNHFAMMEAVLVLATLLQDWIFVDRTPAPLETETLITQRPARPVEMTLKRRRR
jgi:cytochrome P450